MTRRRTLGLLSPLLGLLFQILAGGIGTASGAESPGAPSAADFSTDVMAVLSKSGCNQGGCHGNQNGKGGFKLSLRGQDAGDDFRAIVRENSGRRVDPLAPDESLLLLKATSQVAHLGGRRFGRESLEYATLRAWIAAGARASDGSRPRVTGLVVTPSDAVLIDPIDSVQLTAVASWSDGSSRDVTRQATYETTNLNVEVTGDGRVARLKHGESTVLVRYLDQQVAVPIAFVPVRTTPSAASRLAPDTHLDRHAFDKLARLSMEPSPVADDATLVRRLYLDLIGALPTADEAREFVADESPEKRVRLLDKLLARSEFAELWALRWSDLLRVEEKVLDVHGVESFHGWIRESLRLGKPLDEFVRDLITARGSTYTNPPANYWRALRDPSGRGETTARLFLGVRLQCAQCHNHPFDRWTQDDYFRWTSLFARVDYRIVSNERKDKLDKNEFEGEQIVEWTDKGEVKNPRTGQVAAPKFLGTSQAVAADAPLDSLAAWLTGPDNRLFARAQANFLWYHVLGRGLFEPIDDLRATNPPANPALLDALADDLVRDRFDLQTSVRRIASSRVYALSSTPNDTNRDDEANFARAIVRRIPAEALLDAQTQTLDSPIAFGGHAAGLRAGQLPGVHKLRDRDRGLTPGDRFLRTFGKPQRLLGCECERSAETTLNQALSLVSDASLQERIARPGNRIDRLAKSGLTSREIVDELYWTMLSRPASSDELQAATQALDAATDRGETLQDLAWALLNAKEFLFRH